MAETDTNRAVAPTYQPAPPLTNQLETYWQIGSELAQFTLHINAHEEAYPLLERLGEPDFQGMKLQRLEKPPNRSCI